MSKFSEEVIKIVRSVPYGRVVSYGQVAAYVGMPRAARIVGWTLRQSRGGLMPWWRVINNAGRISIKDNFEHDAMEQKELLQGEGVKVGDGFDVEIEKYRFVADEKQMREWGLPKEYLEMLWEKYKRGT